MSVDTDFCNLRTEAKCVFLPVKPNNSISAMKNEPVLQIKLGDSGDPFVV